MRRCPIKESGVFTVWSLHRGLAGLLLLAVFLPGCVSSGVSGPFALVPSEGDHARFSEEGLTVSALHLGEEDSAKYLEGKGFVSLSGDLKKLELFVLFLEVVNRTGKETIIDPGGIRFLTGHGLTLSPRNYAHLYSDLPPGPAREEVLKGFHRISLSRMEIIPPGGSLERILFFSRPEKVGDQAGLFLGSLYVGGKSLDKVLLSFKAVPLED